MPPSSRGRLLVGGALAATVVIVVGAALGLQTIPGSGFTPDSPPTPTPSPDSTLVDGFPKFVFGMRVVTVGDALGLIGDGSLDGRAVAVRGWFMQSLLSCPRPPRFMAPLEGSCHGEVFASGNFQQMTCQDFPDGSSECHSNGPPPGVAALSPFVMTETSGALRLWEASSAPGLDRFGVPAVLVGHARDPRLWHCPPETRSACASAFVVDRVAWVAGETLEVVPPDQGVPQRMTLDEVEAAAGLEGEPLTAAALKMGVVPRIDPRLHGVGDGTVWMLRAFRPDAETDAADPTRAVEVWLIDDATGQMIASTGLEMDAAYEPARLLVQATRNGGADNDEIHPFYRVERLDGTGLQQDWVSGWWSGDDTVARYGAGLAAVLEPGDYVVRAWRATVDRDETMGEPRDECMTEISLDPLNELRVEASFPDEGPCTWVAPTFEDMY